MKLVTIQKRENLNTVHREGIIGPGGAYHDYMICIPHEDDTDYVLLQFQKGSRRKPDSRHGILDTDLLEIVRDRLICFQAGPFACRENALMLTHIEEALMWSNRRVEDRIERDVLGTDNK